MMPDRSGWLFGSVPGSGYGTAATGTGYGYGDGTGVGEGDGYGYGTGVGEGDGDGYGIGTGDGYGTGVGEGDGDGYGIDYGAGVGYEDGDGVGYEDGDRSESWQMTMDHSDEEYISNTEAYFRSVTFPAERALSLPNAELRRMAIEQIGPDRLYAELDAIVVHEDTDGVGNPRALLRVPMEDTQLGYLQAVRVVCPTTGRVYHLVCDQTVTTCQAAVASLFGLRAEEYAPVRET